MPLDSLLGPQITSLIAYATAILTAFALLYGFTKIAWTKLSGRPFPDNRVTRALDALAELGSNLVGFVNKVKRGDGQPLIPNPEVVARDATIAELRATLSRVAASLPMLAEKQGALDASETRPPGIAHPAQLFAPSFDPGQRQTIAPEVVAAAREATRDGQRGHTSLSALVVTVVLSGLVLAVGAMLFQGCTPARRFVLDHTDGVPARVSCVPRTQRCSVTDAGVYLPVQCSDDHREWPAMPLRPDGSQRTCALGEGCEVDADSGIASCTAADGGQ